MPLEQIMMFRDCSNGQNFGTGVAGSKLEQMLRNSQPDNNTHCDLITDEIGRVQTCISLCQGDFCNGPQTPAIEGGGVRFQACILMTLIVVLLLN